MMTINVDASQFAINQRTGQAAIVADGLFGGIAITQLKNTWEQFTESSEHIGLNHIRWPGGTLSEAGYFDPSLSRPTIRLIDGDPPAGWIKAYSTDYPDLIHPILISSGAYVGFQTVLSYAVEHDMSLSITLPVEQMYLLDSSSKVSSVSSFLSNLFLLNDSKLANLKQPIVIDIGNEQYNVPEAYAEAIASTLIATDAFREANPTDNFQIAVQTMKSQGNSQIFINKLESLNCGSVLSNIDVVRHHFLGIGLNNSANIEATPERISPVHDLVQLIESAGDRSIPVMLYASAFSADSLDVEASWDNAGSHNQRGVPLSLASAASLVSLITGFVELGYSNAALWGLGTNESQSTVASYRDDGMKYSPVAEAYRMMAENIRGMVLVEDPRLDDNRTNADVFHYSFVDSSKIILFLAADDLPDNSLDVRLCLEGFGNIGNAWLERIVVDGETAGAATTVVESILANGSAIDLHLEKDFDFMMVTILRDRPGADYIHAVGSDASELLRAGSGGSLIEAGGGSDTLIGGAGADYLTGGLGSDVICGGAGVDTMVGGAGNDIFVIRAQGATDTILDFEIGTDRIDLSDWFRHYGSDSITVEQTKNGAVIQLGAEHLIINTLNEQPAPIENLLISDITALWGRDLENTKIGSVITVSSVNPSVGGGIYDDVFLIGYGAKNIDGGAGFDCVDYRLQNTPQLIDLIFSNINKGLSTNNTYTSIEGVVGGGGADNIRGDYNDNRLYGQANTDWIYGRRGNDILDGGVGNDVLLGGLGADTLIGGLGKDRAQYSESQIGVTADLQFSIRNTGDADGDIYLGIEDIAGSSFGDFLFGNSCSNSIFGRNGEDLLDGREGNDYLNGGAGKDTLVGGDGCDTLRGGSHSDTFIFSGGQDIIEDFRTSDFDKLAIDSELFSSNRTAEWLIANLAIITGDDVVLNFGNGNTITLDGICSMLDLADLVYFI